MEKKKRNKLIIYAILLAVGLLVFILEVFVFQKPDGILGAIICIGSIYLTLGSVIKLCKLSPTFKDAFIAILDNIMWLP